MNTSSSAGDALLFYIDSLLPNEETHGEVSGEQQIAGPLKIEPVCHDVTSGEGGGKDILRLQHFKAAGIPLAISLSGISEIVEVESADLKSIRSEEGVILRTLTHRGRNIQVLDTRDIILPHRHPARRESLDKGKYCVLLLSGVAYGLLCDDVDECADVDRRNVVWRGQRATRLWLAGMVKESNRALLDETKLIQVFDQLNITD